MSEKKRKAEKKIPERRTLRAALTALFWLALWEMLSLIIAKPLILPGPVETIKALILLLGTESFYLDVLCTLLRCVLGVIISFALGYYLALVAYRHGFLREFLRGPVRFFKAIPVMAIIIYLVLLVSSSQVAIIVCLFMCFPIAYTNVLGGLDSTPKEYLELAQIMELTERETDRYIRKPSVAPNIRQALSLMCGMSFKVVIASEVLSIPAHSLGYEMLNAKYYLNTADLFAYMAVILTLALFFEKVVGVMLKNYDWRPYEGTKTASLQEKSRASHPERDSEIGNENSAVILDRVTKQYPGAERPVLDDFNLTAEAGKVTALMGPSGIGKTTTARLISGLEQPDKGTVSTGNAVVSYMFQEDRLLPWLNVYDNMALSGNTERDEIIAMAEALELRDALFRLPGDLSGGMRQRVALGRTLLKDADVIILDEPFKGLDEELKQRIIAGLWTKSTENRTVLLITHDEEDAGSLADTTLNMN